MDRVSTHADKRRLIGHIYRRAAPCRPAGTKSVGRWAQPPLRAAHTPGRARGRRARGQAPPRAPGGHSEYSNPSQAAVRHPAVVRTSEALPMHQNLLDRSADEQEHRARREEPHTQISGNQVWQSNGSPTSIATQAPFDSEVARSVGCTLVTPPELTACDREIDPGEGN